MTKTRKIEGQTRKKTKLKNPDQEHSDINQHGNHTAYANRDISEKKQLFIGNLHSDTTEEDLYILFGLRSTQYLEKNCLVKKKLLVTWILKVLLLGWSMIRPLL